MPTATQKPTNRAARHFSETVRRELTRKEWGIRTLARRMAAEPKGYRQIENERRQLQDWLNGPRYPLKASRRKVARALGIKLSDLEYEEAEPSPLERELRRAVRRVMKREQVRS